MRVVIQRVLQASVTVKSQKISAINNGLLILLGVCEADTDADVEWLAGKIARLRIFNDEQGTMNLSISDIKGEALVVSQFTLFASYKKGNRPSWVRCCTKQEEELHTEQTKQQNDCLAKMYAARHEVAIPLYEKFCKTLSQNIGKPVRTGIFGADMKVELINDGPVTICMDTKNRQ